MDMRRHLRRWLTDVPLQKMGGVYEGVIANVVEEEVRNRFTTKREVQPVIEFDDGWRSVPNLSMRRDLVDGFGPDTDTWVGRRLRIVRRLMRNRTTAKASERWEKAVEFPDSTAGEPVGRASLRADDTRW